MDRRNKSLFLLDEASGFVDYFECQTLPSIRRLRNRHWGVGIAFRTSEKSFYKYGTSITLSLGINSMSWGSDEGREPISIWLRYKIAFLLLLLVSVVTWSGSMIDHHSIGVQKFFSSWNPSQNGEISIKKSKMLYLQCLQLSKFVVAKHSIWVPLQKFVFCM